MNNIYINNIYERYKDLKNSNKTEFDNNNLWKIFEYYSCIQLTKEYKKQFYEYNDIDPNFKEVNKMSHKDTSIDCCDLENTIVQCKLIKKSLTYLECTTFFTNSNIFSKELNESIIKWNNLIITRNKCLLSKELMNHSNLFIDRPYSQDELIKFCDDLILTSPKYTEIKNEFVLRYYQIESINLIKENKKNIIINLPTGTGKNSVIIYSFEDNLKYLILVPRIVLLEQLYEEIIKHKPKLKNEIQLIGNNNNKFNKKKLITICVYNSVYIIKDYCSKFEKIYIDEAHHINVPKIYSCNELSEKESETYINIIKSFIKYNNNVYLSATIDEIDNFLYYSKDIRSMINEKYLCDYTINIPIFNEDPTNRNICEYLLKYYRNIIIYCKSCAEGNNINTILNELQLNSSEYIDCNTSKKDRNNIINKYKNGDVPFLVNVRLLVEGFDSSITKGVCFLHLSKCKTALIQIIGRCLRLDKSKVIANIILPYSIIEDENRISNFLKIIAKNDFRIQKSYINKILGGYISIDYGDDIKIEDPNIILKYETVYNSMGKSKNFTDICDLKLWYENIDKVKKYILEFNKYPSSRNPDKNIKELGQWLNNNIKHSIKHNNTGIFINKEIRDEWDFFINDKIYYKHMSKINIWYNEFNTLKKYIEANNKLPSINNDIETNNLAVWYYDQNSKYETRLGIMKNDFYYKKWENFLTEYEYIIKLTD